MTDNTNRNSGKKMNSKRWFAPYSTGIKTVHSISVPASPWIYSLRANTHKYFEVEHNKEDKGRGGKEMGLLLIPYDWPRPHAMELQSSSGLLLTQLLLSFKAHILLDGISQSFIEALPHFPGVTNSSQIYCVCPCGRLYMNPHILYSVCTGQRKT